MSTFQLTLRVPIGCTVQQWADGSFRILGPMDSLVIMRDNLATVTNEATITVVQRLQAEKLKRQREERAIAKAARPPNDTSELEQEIDDTRRTLVQPLDIEQVIASLPDLPDETEDDSASEPQLPEENFISEDDALPAKAVETMPLPSDPPEVSDKRLKAEYTSGHPKPKTMGQFKPGH